MELFLILPLILSVFGLGITIYLAWQVFDHPFKRVNNKRFPKDSN